MVQMLQTGFTELAAIDKFYQCYMDVESLLAAQFLKFGRKKRTKGILIYAFILNSACIYCIFTLSM